MSTATLRHLVKYVLWYSIVAIMCVMALVSQIFIFVPAGHPIRQQLVRLSNRSAPLRPLLHLAVDVPLELADAKVRAHVEQNIRHEFIFDEAHGHRMKTPDTVNATRNLTHSICQDESVYRMSVTIGHRCRRNGDSIYAVVLSLEVPIPEGMQCFGYRIPCDAVVDHQSLPLLTTAGASQVSFPDTRVLFQSDVRYVITCSDAGGTASRCYSTDLIRHGPPPCNSTTPASAVVPSNDNNSSRTPNTGRVPWETQYKEKYSRQWGAEYLAILPSEKAMMCQCLYRNIKITIQIGRSIIDTGTDATEREGQGFALSMQRYFILTMMRYGDFGLDEYRVSVLQGAHLRAENELGLLYPATEIRHQLYESGSKQSHELVRAWLGGGLIPFDVAQQPDTVTLDKGLNSLVGNLVLHPPIPAQMIGVSGMLNHLTHYPETDKALKDMTPYTDTRHEILYYMKGQIFFAILAQRMESAVPGSFCTLFRWLYVNRNVPITAERVCEGIAEMVGGPESSAAKAVNCRGLFDQYYYNNVGNIAKDPEAVNATANAARHIFCNNL